MKPNQFFGVTIIVGTILTFIGNALHPVIPLFNPDAYTAETSGTWWALIHGFLLVGILLLTLGFLQVYAALRLRGESTFSLVGLFSFAFAGVLWSIIFVLDGFVGPRLAAAYRSASAADQPALAALLDYHLSIQASLLVVAFLLSAVGTAFLGGAMLRARLYPRGLAGAGVAVGLVVVGGYAVGFYGPYFVGGLIFTVVASALLIWALAVAVFLMRGKPSPGLGAPA